MECPSSCGPQPKANKIVLCIDLNVACGLTFPTSADCRQTMVSFSTIPSDSIDMLPTLAVLALIVSSLENKGVYVKNTSDSKQRGLLITVRNFHWSLPPIYRKRWCWLQLKRQGCRHEWCSHIRWIPYRTPHVDWEPRNRHTYIQICS